MGFALCAEDVDHGLSDGEPLPLFDLFKATWHFSLVIYSSFRVTAATALAKEQPFP